MAQIFLIKDSRSFGLRLRVKTGSGFFVCPSKGLPLESLIAANVLEPIKEICNEETDARFIKDYIDLIAQLNKRYGNKLLWWATDVSSKNRYVSFFADYTHELAEVARILVQHRDDQILIVDPSPAIERSLRKLLQGSGRPIYWRLPAGRATLRAWVCAGRKIGGVFYNALKYGGRTVYSRFYLKDYFQRKAAKKPYYVIKTFTYASSWDEQGRYREGMFGRLADFLGDKNILVWTFDSRNFKGLIQNILKGKGGFVLPVEFFLSLKDILKSVVQVLFFRIPVKDKVFFRNIDVTDILCYELTRSFNGIQLIQYLHYHATCNLLKALPVETLLLNYENNPWERMCILAVRHNGSSAKVLSFQGSVVPLASLNFFISPEEKSIIPMPDEILTPGRIPTEAMTQYGDYSAAKVTVACNFRYEYLDTIQPLTRSLAKRVLVILDGVKQTHLFVEYILKQTETLGDYHFIIRPHPMLPWSILSSTYGFRLEGRNHVTLSKEPLQEELKAAGVVIYWQSSVCLEALSMGKPMVNFNPNTVLSFDPLYGQHFLKWTVSPGDSLGCVLHEVYSLSDEKFDDQRQKAKDFIGQYFFPVSEKRAQAFL